MVLRVSAVAMSLVATGCTPSAPALPDLELVNRYCTDCHSDGESAGGLSLEGRHADALPEEAAVWERVIAKLGAGMMPPPGEPRPAEAALTGLVDRITSVLDAAAAEVPDPGAPVLRRLNRTEYANAVRDLLNLPIDVATLLPADDSSEGFDNIGEALSISASHVQAYVAAAAKISRLAVGDATTSPTLSSYDAPGDFDHTYHVEGLPFGTRSGIRATHVFPLDAEYEFTVRRFGGGIFIDSVGGDEAVELLLDGERIQLLPPGSPPRVRVKVSAGPHEIAAAVIEDVRPHGVDDTYAVLARTAGVSGLSIMGPFDASGPGDTPSRARIFVCMPQSEGEELDCARRILRPLARLAFRRGLEDDDAALEPLLEAFATGSALRGFETGVQYALARLLVDPQFLFRFEDEPVGLSPGTAYELGAYDIASRLSFFLWSSIPDEELLDLAASGELLEPNVLADQVDRMLADARADALAENFAGQWLRLRQVESVNPAAAAFDGNLRSAFIRETEMLFDSIVREDGSIVDLLDADYTFVDERLARHYGIPNIRGSHFRRVPVTADERRGLLGHGSILTVTSAPNRTSPVIRGAWILENVLGTPAPSPPPGVETNLEREVTAEALPESLRARLERHRADPSCAACHALIDPLGFALENFDEIGRWREFDGRERIDASGTLWDGTQLDGAASLRAALLARREAFVGVAVEKLLTYALGRAVEYYDMPTVRRIVRDAAADEYRFSALVLGIVNSVPFRMKAALPADSVSAVGG
jgi:hypothetical protein